MAKLNKIAHSRLLLQAQEAKEMGLDRLARGMFFALKLAEEDADMPVSKYSYEQMQEEIYQELWELVSKVAQYYDVDNITAEKIDDVLQEMRDNFLEKVEEVLGVEEGSVGALEPEVPGETKEADI